MATPESLATNVVRLSASQSNARIFRNNSGACKDDTDRLVRFGLGNDGTKASKNIKFGDYIGYTSITITPDMIGSTVAVFTNLEIKPDGHLDATLHKACRDGSRENIQWKTCEMVKAAGGFAGFATNSQDTKDILNVSNITKK